MRREYITPPCWRRAKFVAEAGRLAKSEEKSKCLGKLETRGWMRTVS
jgi:hypothetical protein